MTKWLTMMNVIVVLAACATRNPMPPRPAWIDNPGDGVSASCTTHVRGRHFQEQLAISRAREQLASRYGMQVKMTQNTQEIVKNDSTSVISIKNTEQKINNNKTVYARVQEKWHDLLKDELWIYLVPLK